MPRFNNPYEYRPSHDGQFFDSSELWRQAKKPGFGNDIGGTSMRRKPKKPQPTLGGGMALRIPVNEGAR